MNTLTTKGIKTVKPLSEQIKIYDKFRKNIFHPKADMPVEKSYLERYKKKFILSEKVIKKIFLDKLSLKVQSISPILTKTSFHSLYVVRAGAKKFVLKVNLLSDVCPGLSFYIDDVVNSFLFERHMPNLPIYIIDPSRYSYPFDYMIMDYLDGESLDKTDQKSAFQDLGMNFSEIHKIKGKYYGTLRVGSLSLMELVGMYKDWNDFLHVNLTKHIDKCLMLGVFDKKTSDFINNVFKKTKINTRKISLLHNDPGQRNVITKNGKIVGVLDWEDAILGDPLWDIAFIDTFLFGKNDRNKFKAFLIGYGSDYKKIYTKKYLLYYLRIAMLKAVSRNEFSKYDNDELLFDRKRINFALDKLRKK